MMVLNIQTYLILFVFLQISFSDAYQENSKFLGNDDPEDRHLGKRRRPSSQGSNPCNFGNGYRRPKDQGTGRTFFDFQFFNVEHNYNLEVNCGGQGGNYPSYPHPAPVTEIHNEDVGGGHKPFGGLGNHNNGGNRPHRPKPPHKPGGGGFLQGLFGGWNKPQQTEGPFKPNSDSQGSGPFGGFFPSPHDFATGLSEGIQGFISTLPAIGESFQSILPSLDNFQWPQLPQFNPLGGNTGPNTGPQQFGPLFPGGNPNRPIPSNPFNGPPSFTAPTSTFPPVFSTSPAFVTTPAPTTTTDPDDIIYSDEIKPVNEDFDPITDPYNTKLSGVNGKYRPNSYYSRGNANQYQNYRRQSPYQYNSRNAPRGRPEGRSFSFPS